MKAHRDALTERMALCGRRGRALFCLASAERLIGCCWAFQAQSGADLKPFFFWTQRLFDALVVDMPANVALDAALEELEQSASHTTDGSPLSVQAQAGILCAMGAIFVLEGHREDGVVTAMNATIDALDNFTFFVNQQVTGELVSPETYALLDRETALQMTHAAFLQDAENFEASTLTNWRLENRQYSVPIAIG